MWCRSNTLIRSLPSLAAHHGSVSGRNIILSSPYFGIITPSIVPAKALSSTASEHINASSEPNRSHRSVLQHDVVRDLFYSFATAPTSEHNHQPPVLRLEDLRSLLLSIGEHPSEDRLLQLMDEVDSDHSGTIEFEEFISGYDKLSKEDPSEIVTDVGQLINEFRLLDRNGDGVLSLDELEGFLSLSSTKDGVSSLSAEDASEIMKVADKNKDGTIDITEFIEFMTNPEKVKHSWRLMNGFRVVMLLGGPGSGKGLLSEKMCATSDIIRHCSSGEMLRSEVAARSPLGLSIETTLSEGKLVPSATVIALLKKQFAKFPQCILTLDGFPRNVDNLLDFTSFCGLPESGIFIDVPEDVMIQRILHRGQSSGRSDDNRETAKMRVETFKEATLPTLEEMDKNGIQVHKLDGTQRPDEVWQELLQKSATIRGHFDRKLEKEREHVLEKSF